MRSAMAPSTARLTAEELLRLPEDGLRHELLAGEHVVTPSPSPKHQRVVGRVYFLLQLWLREHGVGEVFVSPLDVVLSAEDVVEPDLLFVAGERAGIVGERYVDGPPDLAVEVLSPSTRRRDELVKLGRYEQLGVTEYWVVDPDAETVKVFRREGSGYGRPTLLAARLGDRLTSTVLPTFEVAVADLFAG
jgi:Uma2 family endonuclease